MNAGLALPMVALALLQGRTRYGAIWPPVVGALGIALLGTGALLFGKRPAETGLAVAGSLLLAGAHVANWRLRHFRF